MRTIYLNNGRMRLEWQSWMTNWSDMRHEWQDANDSNNETVTIITKKLKPRVGLLYQMIWP